MIFTHFQGVSVTHPLVGMNVLASMEIACIYRASQADGFSLKTLLPATQCMVP